MAALLFLYGTVLGRPLDQLAVVRAIRPARLPTVLTRDEVRAVLAGLAGVHRLVALLQYGADIRTLQSLLGHKDVRTTMVYTHVLQRRPVGLKSPLDRLGA